MAAAAAEAVAVVVTGVVKVTAAAVTGVTVAETAGAVTVGAAAWFRVPNTMVAQHKIIKQSVTGSRVAAAPGQFHAHSRQRCRLQQHHEPGAAQTGFLGLANRLNEQQTLGRKAHTSLCKETPG